MRKRQERKHIGCLYKQGGFFIIIFDSGPRGQWGLLKSGAAKQREKKAKREKKNSISTTKAPRSHASGKKEATPQQKKSPLSFPHLY